MSVEFPAALGPVVPVVYWPGSGSSVINKTAYGFYEDDDQFVEEAPFVAKWVCSSLGYPIMQVELTDEIIYRQYEAATMEYSSIVNEFNIRENMLALQGTSTGSSVTHQLVRGNALPTIVEMAESYGVEAGVGGNVTFKKGSITLNYAQQDYDLQGTFAEASESGKRIEIRKVWHHRTPAIQRFFDPFAGGATGGVGIENMLGEFGFQRYSVASQYLLMPLYETLLRTQAIELNDEIRRSLFSFEIRNNVLRITPVPSEAWQGAKLWFEYIVKEDKFAGVVGNSISSGSVSQNGSLVSDYSNVPYTHMQYSNINAVGRSWIRRYTLALCKEVLGLIRSKYERIPIPNAEINLDGMMLRQEAQREKEELTEKLRETLAKTGRQNQLEVTKENEANIHETLRFVPTQIYVR